jgi:hypothetical protein
MAGIKSPILDVMTQLRNTMPELQTIRVFNDQINREREGKYPNYAKPAAFIEILADIEWGQLSEGVSSADLGFRVHIVHEFYDAQDGSFEQDLAIFDLRDQVIATLMLFEPTACGAMQKITEVPDYGHDNLYVYMVDFATHFIDDKGIKPTITATGVQPVINATFDDPKNYIIPH